MSDADTPTEPHSDTTPGNDAASAPAYSDGGGGDAGPATALNTPEPNKADTAIVDTAASGTPPAERSRNFYERGGDQPTAPAGNDAVQSSVDAADQVVYGPDAFEAFTTPDGFAVNPDVLNSFEPLARDMGLTQKEAQHFVDLHSKTMMDVAEAQTSAVSQMLTGWKNDARSDGEYGGDNFDQSVQIAAKAIGRFGTPALREALDETGMGNHPEMIRFAWRVGQSISEDAYIGGQPAPERPKTRAEILYPRKNED